MDRLRHSSSRPGTSEAVGRRPPGCRIGTFVTLSANLPGCDQAAAACGVPESRSWGVDQAEHGRSWTIVYCIVYRFLASAARLAVRSGRSKDLDRVAPPTALLRWRIGGRISEREAMKRREPAGSQSFVGFRFPPDVILLAVRWYLRYGLSYRDVEELLAERGVDVDHVTIYRWVQRFTPLLIDTARSAANSSTARSSGTKRQLKRLILDYIKHYNTHRPHRSLDQRPPLAPATTELDEPPATRMTRSTRCDGLINEYRNAA